MKIILQFSNLSSYLEISYSLDYVCSRYDNHNIFDLFYLRSLPKNIKTIAYILDSIKYNFY